MKKVMEYVEKYKPSPEALKIVDDVLKQGDVRCSDPWMYVMVAGFITNGAISIETTDIKNPQEDKEITVKGPQEYLKRIAASLLKEKGFCIEDMEKSFSGGIVDVIGRKGNEYILVECGPCRISKPIDYLGRENVVLWVLTKKPHGIVLYEITRGENWDRFIEFHKEEQFEGLRKSMEDIDFS